MTMLLKALKEGAISVQEEDPRYPHFGTSAISQKRSMELTAGISEHRGRLSIPRRGHVLSTIVETYAEPVRESVGILCSALSKKKFSKSVGYLSVAREKRIDGGRPRSEAEMTAWAIVAMWVVGVAAKAFTTNASLADAEDWFCGSYTSERWERLISDVAVKEAEAQLRRVADGSAYAELLPYILDPHGPGSRLSVRRDPTTHSARARKRAEGVFYTPADVAEYMAGACLGGMRPESFPSILDPACGTGVFLRAALREVKRLFPDKDAFSIARECLFGTDIDPWPLNATAFVLLWESRGILEGSRMVPVEAWRTLRRNFACVDALRIDPADANISRPGRISISEIFPSLGHGPTMVLGNPPYADVGARSDLSDLGLVFRTIEVKPRANAEIYLPFVEQMIRLGNGDVCGGALVLPLSVACNVSAQFSTLRRLIAESKGQWKFAFFDREPHALFGEDVKTRNTIMLWSRSTTDERPVIFTGPLRKWRGDSRAEMFKSVKFTAIDADIRDGIPKVEGDNQAVAFRVLSLRWGRLRQVASISRIDLVEASDSDDRTVFVGATAYNFINVFLRPDKGLFHGGRALSEHPLHAVQCSTREDALAIFAILSSHLAYWWWHTQGDGFHVSRRFIAELPFGIEDLTEKVSAVLAVYGFELWNAIKTKPILSLNRGRMSLAYTPNGHDTMRCSIDRTLAELAGLKTGFVNELQRFTAKTVAADL